MAILPVPLELEKPPGRIVSNLSGSLPSLFLARGTDRKLAVDFLLIEEDGCRSESSGDYSAALMKYRKVLDWNYDLSLAEHCVRLACWCSASVLNSERTSKASALSDEKTVAFCLETASFVLSRKHCKEMTSAESFRKVVCYLQAMYFRRKKKFDAALLSFESGIFLGSSLVSQDVYLLGLASCLEAAGLNTRLHQCLQDLQNLIRAPTYAFTPNVRFSSADALDSFVSNALQPPLFKKKGNASTQPVLPRKAATPLKLENIVTPQKSLGRSSGAKAKRKQLPSPPKSSGSDGTLFRLMSSTSGRLIPHFAPDSALRPSVYRRRWDAAVCIQRYLRGYFVRRSMANPFCHGKTTLRKLSRAKSYSADHDRRLSAVQLVQKYRDEKRRLESAVFIQRVFRGYRVRLALFIWKESVRRSAAVVIQSLWKLFQTRRRFLHQRQSGLDIQKWLRSRWQYPYDLRLVRYLQAIFRGVLQRIANFQRQFGARCLRSYVRRKALQRYLFALKLSATNVQRICRSWSDRRLANCRRASAALMCSFIRSCITRRVLAETVRLVCRIQALFRRAACLRRILFLRCLSSFVSSHVRMRLSRRSYLQMKDACTTICSCIRQVRAKEFADEARVGFLRLSALATGHLARRRVDVIIRSQIKISRRTLSFLQQQRQLREQRAALTIQRVYRGFSANVGLSKRLEAASRIQQFVAANRLISSHQRIRDLLKRVILRWKSCKFRNSFLRLRRIVLSIQRRFRLVLRVQSTDLACRRIQFWWRHLLALSKKKQMNLCASRIQNTWLSCLLRRKFLQTRASVILAQSLWRRSVHWLRFQRQRAACVKLQQWVRCKRCLRIFRHNRRVMKLLIRVCRTHISRLHLHRDTQMAIHLQRAWRRHHSQVVVRKLQRSACLLQKMGMRMVSQSVQCLRYTASQHVLSFVRCAIYRLKRNRMAQFQRLLRRIVSRFLARRFWKKIVRAFDTLRAHIRKRIVFRKLLRSFHAAVRIQRLWRSMQERQRLRSQKLSAILIQQMYRSHRAMFLTGLRSQLATKIQSVFRKVLCSRMYLRLLQNCIAFQTNVRGRLAKCAYRQFVARVQRVQCEIRRWVHAHYAQRILRASRLISRVCRGRYARLHLRWERERSEPLQRAFRVFSARRLRDRQMVAARQIQSMYCCRRDCRVAFNRRNMIRLADIQSKLVHQITLNCRMHAASIILQQRSRGFLMRLHRQMMMRSALRLQTWFRGFLCRQRLTRLRSSVLILQRLIRQRMDWLRTIKRSAAAAVLQRRWRQILDRRQFSAVQLGLSKIQPCSKFRHRQARVSYLWKRVQQCGRGWLMLRNFRRFRRLIAKIGVVWRSKIVRLKMARCHRCAAVIQLSWRKTLAFRRIRRIQIASSAIAVKAQSFLSHSSALRRSVAAKTLGVAVKMRSHHRKMSSELAARLVLQSSIRRFLVPSFSRYCRIICLIQSAMLLQHGLKRMFALKRLSSLLSPIVRGMACRQILHSHEAAASVVQKWLRKRFADIRRRRKYELQSTVRRVLLMFFQKRRFRRAVNASTRIAATWRMYVRRRQFVRLIAIALRLQKFFWNSSHRVRQEGRDKNIRTIQRVMKGSATRSIVKRWDQATDVQKVILSRLSQLDLERLHARLSRFQSMFRMYRQLLFNNRSREAALLIQQFVRRKLTLCRLSRFCKLFLHVIVQRRVVSQIKESSRANVASHVLSRFVRHCPSIAFDVSRITRIQSVWKSIVCRRNIGVRHSSALQVQRWWRHCCRRSFFHQRWISAVVIQRQLFGPLLLARRRLMALRIQAFWRGYVVRKQLRRQASESIAGVCVPASRPPQSHSQSILYRKPSIQTSSFSSRKSSYFAGFFKKATSTEKA
eukprot:ANDGO_02055.mRNA.1 hypothetical protein